MYRPIEAVRPHCGGVNNQFPASSFQFPVSGRSSRYPVVSRSLIVQAESDWKPETGKWKLQSAGGIGKRAVRLFCRTVLRRSGIDQLSPHAEQRIYTTVRPSESAFADTALQRGQVRKRPDSPESRGCLSTLTLRCHNHGSCTIHFYSVFAARIRSFRTITFW